MNKKVVKYNAFYQKLINIELNIQLSNDVICFDFASLLMCLLHNKRLMKEANL